MYLLLLMAVIGLKALLCKGLALAIILLLFWIKGRQLQFKPDEWNNFFLSCPAAKIRSYAMGIYLTAAVISSVISYFILKLAGYRHSLGTAVLIFAGGLAITAHRWNAEGKSYLSKSVQKIHKTISEEREKENWENE